MFNDSAIPSTNFGLIRHSLTLWNEEKRIQGQQNSPLSATGRRMAVAWGQELCSHHWHRILVSDLERALDTVELINRQLMLPVHVDPLLREQNWGEWSGLRLKEVFTNYSREIKEQEAAGWSFRPPGGESRKEVLARSLHSLRMAANKWPGENILTVCHEGVIKSLLYHLLDRNFLPDEPKIIKGYQLHLLQSKGGKPELTQVNELQLTGKKP